jgi:glucan biosynthesis protein C
MLPNDRLHALDAVRAFALLLGVVLHSAAAFLQDFPISMWVDKPSAIAAVIYYTIHMFRMSAFFLIAGFFARILVERRGVQGFMRDRGKRVGIPLLMFPLIQITIALGLVFGALLHGYGFLLSLQNLTPPPPPAGAAPAAAVEGGGGIDFAHLWFLYYLLMFYALALGLRALMQHVDPKAAVAGVCDRLVAFLMSGLWGPVLIALPIAAYLWQFNGWTEWLGLPAPTKLLPNVAGLIGYGIAFGLGWLLNRQVPRLLALQNSWWLYLLAAIALTVLCFNLIGTTPLWTGPTLGGNERIYYTLAYMTGSWCWVFALVGAAVRFLSGPHPYVRYLADASYWIYLMHMTTIIFFLTLMRPYDWYWAIKLTIMVGGSLPLLLLSYHAFVRYTWIGALLNGRRHPRPLLIP